MKIAHGELMGFLWSMGHAWREYQSLQAKCASLSTLYTTLLSSESSSLADSIAGAALLNFAKAYAATMEQVL